MRVSMLQGKATLTMSRDSLFPPRGSETAATAYKLRKGEFFGKGAVVQILGLVCCLWLGFFGLVAGIILLVVGSFMARVWACSECRGTLDKEASVCPHCRARFNDFDSNDTDRDKFDGWRKTMSGR
jgi:hypothetical protein